MSRFRSGPFVGSLLCLALGHAAAGCGGGGGGGTGVTGGSASTPTIAFTSAGSSQPEGGSTTIEVELSLPAGVTALSHALQVTFETSGSATSGLDYDTLPGITFPAGSPDRRRVAVSLIVRADALLEGAESVTLSLRAPGARVVGQGTHDVTVQDSGAASVEFVSASSAAPEAGGAHSVTVALSTTGGSTLVAPLTVVVQSGAGTAAVGVDFAAGPYVASFPAGSGDGATAVAILPVLTDMLVEGDETVVLALTSVTAPATIGAGAAHSVTVFDDEAASIAFASASSATTNEVAAGHVVSVALTTGGTTLAVPVSVTVASGGGTATAGADHTAVSILVTFPSGSVDGATQDVILPVRADLLVEGNETVALALSAAAAPATLGLQAAHLVTITDDDTAEVAFELASSATTNEAAAGHVVRVALTTGGATLAVPVSVMVASGGGTATAGADHTAVSTLVTFPSGSIDGATQDVSLPVRADLLVEGDETVGLALSAASAPATLGLQVGHVLTITDDETAEVAFELASSATTNESGASFTVRVRLGVTGGASLASAVTATASSGGGTAIVGTDYTAVSTTVTFPSGAADGAFQLVSLPVLGDALVEGNETVVLTLAASSAPATLGGTTTHTVTIADDEFAQVNFLLASSSTGNEGAVNRFVDVRLTTTNGGRLASAMTVTVTSGGGTATAAVDYTAVSTVLTFPADAVTNALQFVSVPIRGDSLAEGDETLVLTLSGVSVPGTLGTGTTHVMTITDDEQAGVSFTAPTSETGDEAVGHPIRVWRTGAGTLVNDLTVTLTTSGGSATSGVDYTPVSTTVTFPAGSGSSASQFVFLSTLADAQTEGAETVVLSLTNPSSPGVVTTNPTHTVTITDDDFAVSFAAPMSITADESAGPHRVQLVLSTDGGTLGAPLTVQVDGTDGTAVAGTDYAAVTAALVVFPAGSGHLTTRTVDLSVIPDTDREGDETLTLTLTAVIGAGQPGPRTTHTVVITEDDVAWTPVNIGLDGGTCMAVALDPTLTSTVYASGLNGAAGGSYRSTDGGATFAPWGSGLSGFARTIIVDPANSAVIYVSGGSGLFKSADAGVSWTMISPPTTSGAVDGLAQHPFAPATLLVGAGFGVFRTTNGGVTWALTSFPPNVVRDLVFDPVDPQTVYASTFTGAWKSADGGSTWVAINTGLTNLSLEDIVVDPVAPATLYAATGAGVFKSTNAGATWSATGLAQSTLMLVFDPLVSTTLYAGRGSGLSRTTNGGTTWSTVSGILAGTPVWDLLVDPNAPATLFAATDRGVARSTDAAASWSLLASAPFPRSTRGITVAPSSPSRLYVAFNLGVSTSTDAAVSWMPGGPGLIGTGQFVASFAIDPVTATKAYAATSNGVFLSVDGSASWTASGLQGTSVDRLVIDPLVPSTLYACSSTGVHKSTDSGGSWSAMNAGLTNVDVNALAIDPVSTATLYAGTSNGVFKTTTGGTSWSPANVGLVAPNVRDIAIDPVTPARLYLATFGSVFTSTNAAASWTSANTGLSINSISRFAVDPLDPLTVFAADLAGVSKTTDGGASWFRVTNGLGSLQPLWIALDPSTPTTVYVATQNGGVFKTTTGGQ